MVATLGLLLAAAAASGGTPSSEAAAPLVEHGFVLEATAEAVGSLRASCAECSWQSAGHEAAVLVLSLDGRYSQHLFLVRGPENAEYRFALGRLEAGRHTLSVALDAGLTAPAARGVTIARVAAAAVPAREARTFAHAPILYARPDTLGRFSDVPLVMWYETEARPAGVRLRYSVVFSNEDGGTPSDRLMATWGRLTDIEYVYGVDLDGMGRVTGEEYQGPKHQLMAFGGSHEAGHPLMYVVTDNNMVSDAARAVNGVPAQTAVRVAPAPVAFDLSGTSREAVMDAFPWTYRVSTQEARREGRVDENARPGDKRVPDPRRFATIEACAPSQDATIAFSLGVRAADGATRWFDSDAGLPEFRIGRKATEFPNGCFRGAVALPPGTRARDVVALRVRAFTRIAGQDEPPVPEGAGRARLERINKLFLLGPDDQPGPSLFSWRGHQPLQPGGPPLELKIR